MSTKKKRKSADIAMEMEELLRVQDELISKISETHVKLTALSAEAIHNDPERFRDYYFPPTPRVVHFILKGVTD